MWNMKCCVIPVIIGATGIVTKDWKISVNNTSKAFSRFSAKKSCSFSSKRNFVFYIPHMILYTTHDFIAVWNAVKKSAKQI
jgi:hypothetical protein